MRSIMSFHVIDQSNHSWKKKNPFVYKETYTYAQDLCTSTFNVYFLFYAFIYDTLCVFALPPTY